MLHREKWNRCKNVELKTSTFVSYFSQMCFVKLPDKFEWYSFDKRHVKHFEKIYDPPGTFTTFTYANTQTYYANMVQASPPLIFLLSAMQNDADRNWESLKVGTQSCAHKALTPEKSAFEECSFGWKITSYNVHI